MAPPFTDVVPAEPLVWGLSMTRTLVLFLVMAAVEGGTVVIVDPWQQVSSARNAERMGDVNEIANAYYMDYAEHRGASSCSSGPVPATPAWLQSAAWPVARSSGDNGYDLAPCLVPDYITEFPHDPGATAAYYRSPLDYRSGYRIMRNIATGRLLVDAPSAELGQTIRVER